jgi:hypothetical protein
MLQHAVDDGGIDAELTAQIGQAQRPSSSFYAVK